MVVKALTVQEKAALFDTLMLTMLGHEKVVNRQTVLVRNVEDEMLNINDLTRPADAMQTRVVTTYQWKIQATTPDLILAIEVATKQKSGGADLAPPS